MFRRESKMQVNILYYCICLEEGENAGKCVVLLYLLREESKMQVNVL